MAMTMVCNGTPLVLPTRTAQQSEEASDENHSLAIDTISSAIQLNDHKCEHGNGMDGAHQNIPISTRYFGADIDHSSNNNYSNTDSTSINTNTIAPNLTAPSLPSLFIAPPPLSLSLSVLSSSPAMKQTSWRSGGTIIISPSLSSCSSSSCGSCPTSPLALSPLSFASSPSSSPAPPNPSRMPPSYSGAPSMKPATLWYMSQKGKWGYRPVISTVPIATEQARMESRWPKKARVSSAEHCTTKRVVHTGIIDGIRWEGHRWRVMVTWDTYGKSVVCSPRSLKLIALPDGSPAPERPVSPLPLYRSLLSSYESSGAASAASVDGEESCAAAASPTIISQVDSKSSPEIAVTPNATTPDISSTSTTPTTIGVAVPESVVSVSGVANAATATLSASVSSVSTPPAAVAVPIVAAASASAVPSSSSLSSSTSNVKTVMEKPSTPAAPATPAGTNGTATSTLSSSVGNGNGEGKEKKKSGGRRNGKEPTDPVRVAQVAQIGAKVIHRRIGNIQYTGLIGVVTGILPPRPNRGRDVRVVVDWDDGQRRLQSANSLQIIKTSYNPPIIGAVQPHGPMLFGSSSGKYGSAQVSTPAPSLASASASTPSSSAPSVPGTPTPTGTTLMRVFAQPQAANRESKDVASASSSTSPPLKPTTSTTPSSAASSAASSTPSSPITIRRVPLTQHMNQKRDELRSEGWIEGARVGHIVRPQMPVGTIRTMSLKQDDKFGFAVRVQVHWDGDPPAPVVPSTKDGDDGKINNPNACAFYAINELALVSPSKHTAPSPVPIATPVAPGTIVSATSPTLIPRSPLPPQSPQPPSVSSSFTSLSPPPQGQPPSVVVLHAPLPLRYEHNQQRMIDNIEASIGSGRFNNQPHQQHHQHGNGNGNGHNKGTRHSPQQHHQHQNQNQNHHRGGVRSAPSSLRHHSHPPPPVTMTHAPPLSPQPYHHQHGQHQHHHGQGHGHGDNSMHMNGHHHPPPHPRGATLYERSFGANQRQSSVSFTTSSVGTDHYQVQGSMHQTALQPNAPNMLSAPSSGWTSHASTSIPAVVSPPVMPAPTAILPLTPNELRTRAAALSLPPPLSAVSLSSSSLRHPHHGNGHGHGPVSVLSPTAPTFVSTQSASHTSMSHSTMSHHHHHNHNHNGDHMANGHHGHYGHGHMDGNGNYHPSENKNHKSYNGHGMGSSLSVPMTAPKAISPPPRNGNGSRPISPARDLPSVVLSMGPSPSPFTGALPSSDSLSADVSLSSLSSQSIPEPKLLTSSSPPPLLLPTPIGVAPKRSSPSPPSLPVPIAEFVEAIRFEALVDLHVLEREGFENMSQLLMFSQRSNEEHLKMLFPNWNMATRLRFITYLREYADGIGYRWK